MELKVVEKGKHRTIPIMEGEVLWFLFVVYCFPFYCFLITIVLIESKSVLINPIFNVS